jgi:gamma-butyrobetaine hydroxylase
MISQSHIIDDGAALRIRWQDGTEARFHAFWLYDNSSAPEIRDPGNGQRLITIDQVPADVRIASVTPADGRLEVTFTGNAAPVRFDADWLRQRIYDRPAAPALVPSEVVTWDAELAGRLPVHALDTVTADARAKRDWLANVRRWGVARLSGMPAHQGAVIDVVRLFGYLRETNYGPTFQVRAEVSPTNLAYTNIGLQAHTDNPYRDPVPTLQLLACLENTVEGGESVVVDGFKAAQVLKAEAPDDFELLATYTARFEYAGQSGVRLNSRRPMIETAADGELRHIRFNSRSISPLTDIPYARMEAYYRAYRHLSEIIDRPGMRVGFRLAPGELFIVDNRRVLHARASFGSSGNRLLEGCYADVDGLYSTLAALDAQLGAQAA